MRIAVLFTFLMSALSFADLPEQLRGDVVPDFFVLAIDNETELGRDDLKKIAAKPGVKRIVLSFFATWCASCREELAVLGRNKGELEKNGVRVYLIDVGESIHGKGAEVEKLVRQFAGDSFPFYFDPNANLLKKFGLIEKTQTKYELPIIVVLDADLKVLKVLREAGKDFPQNLWSEF
jgi:thiol-disulfide isomerase/thioredoxin